MRRDEAVAVAVEELEDEALGKCVLVMMVGETTSTTVLSVVARETLQDVARAFG